MMKPTKMRPNHSSQLSVHIENSSRNSRKNTAPTAGPRKLCMPPMTTMASNSPEKCTAVDSAAASRCRKTMSEPARPVTVADSTKASSL